MNDHGLANLDATRIRQTITALICAVDLRDFAAAERLFAPRVRVDYTSLWGGEAAEMAREELLAGWRSLVPGFDATWHELGAIEVQLEQQKAGASCPVAARHWIGSEIWLPKGRYEFALTRSDSWRIAAMKLVLMEEIGSRALVEKARARVSAIAAGTQAT